jgi:hypothetical protein
MSFFGGLKNILKTPAIPGIPNSTVIDPFGLGIAPSIVNTVSSSAGAVSQQISSVSKNLPYIIIGGGTIFLIYLLKK